MAGCCECGNETSGSIICGEFSDLVTVSSSGRSLLRGISYSSGGSVGIITGLRGGDSFLSSLLRSWAVAPPTCLVQWVSEFRIPGDVAVTTSLNRVPWLRVR